MFFTCHFSTATTVNASKYSGLTPKDNYNNNNNTGNSSFNSYENNCSSRKENIIGVFMCHEELSSLT